MTEPLMLGVDKLKALVAELHRMGFKVKLDTSGVLVSDYLLGDGDNSPDYIAIDIKAPQGKYGRFLQQFPDRGESRLAGLLWDVALSGVDCELRTTVHRLITSYDDLKNMKRQWIDSLSDVRQKPVTWYLQRFRESYCYDTTLKMSDDYPQGEFLSMARELGAKVRGVQGYNEEGEEI